MLFKEYAICLMEDIVHNTLKQCDADDFINTCSDDYAKEADCGQRKSQHVSITKEAKCTDIVPVCDDIVSQLTLVKY